MLVKETQLNLNPHKTIYFAYGSNIHPGQMKRRCPDARFIEPLMLEGFELDFNKTATLRHKTKGRVPGILWEISRADEDYLDKCEGYPKAYYKFFVGRIMVYVMTEGYRPPQPPRAAYFKRIYKGYTTFNLPVKYLQARTELSIREHKKRRRNLPPSIQQEIRWYDSTLAR